jgi:hypothetical protein
MTTGTAWQVLLGRERHRSKQWAVLVVGLFIGSLLWFARMKALDFPQVHETLWWEWYAILLLGLIVLQTVHNGGILLSWALAFGAVAGLILNHLGIGMTGDISLLGIIRWAVLLGVAGAVTVGTLGFLLGVLIRRGTEQLDWNPTPE